MSRHDKYIRTSRYELWRRMRLCAWAVIPINFIRRWLEGAGPRIASVVADAGGGLQAYLAALSILFVEVILTSSIVFLVWWFVCSLLMSRARREASFSPTRDIEYYRDKLRGLSAVQVSMLADLRIEPREDAAATLLSLVQRGVLAFEGEALRVADADAAHGLSRSDRMLVRLTLSGGLESGTYAEWASLAEEEAVDDVHLHRIGSKSDRTTAGLNGFLKGCGTGCLVIVVLSVVFGLFSITAGKGLMDVINQAKDDYEMVPYIVEQPLLLPELIFMVVIAIAVGVGLFLPLIDTVVGLIENGDASRYLRRTALGEQETELVYGIRNYLRDFTALSDADKGTIAIWDEFLLYAVALGQNRRAVNELLGMRGIRPASLGL